jgi:hypothetical protein
MSIRLSLLSIFIGFLLLGMNVHALEFRLLALGNEITDLNYKLGSEVVPVNAGENGLSPPYQWTGGGALTFFRKIENEGKVTSKVVATFTPPEGLKQAILILVPEPADATYTGLWMDDSQEARPVQTITYRNFSRYTIAIQLGDEQFTVAPKSFVVCPTGPTNQRVVLKAAVQTGNGWQLIASTSQSVRVGRRTLVILRDGRPQSNGESALVDFILFHDRPSPSPAAAPSSPGR